MQAGLLPKDEQYFLGIENGKADPSPSSLRGVARWYAISCFERPLSC